MTGLATYHSTKRVKAGEIIRIHPDTNACVVRAEDGGEIRVPLPPSLTKLAQVGHTYVENLCGKDFQDIMPYKAFCLDYTSRASNL